MINDVSIESIIINSIIIVGSVLIAVDIIHDLCKRKD
mgnify:CR=1 FL=1